MAQMHCNFVVVLWLEPLRTTVSVPVGGCDMSLDKNKTNHFQHTSNFIVVPLTVVPPSPSPVPSEFWVEKLFLKYFPVPENNPPVVC